MNDYELTEMVERAAQGAHDSRASLYGGPGWILLDPADKNTVREAALPFIVHGVKALDQLGYRKPRIINTAEELDALPDMTVVRSSAGSIVNIVGCRAYIFGVAGSASALSLALPATVLHEPTL